MPSFGLDYGDPAPTETGVQYTRQASKKQLARGSQT